MYWYHSYTIFNTSAILEILPQILHNIQVGIEILAKFSGNPQNIPEFRHSVNMHLVRE